MIAPRTTLPGTLEAVTRDYTKALGLPILLHHPPRGYSRRRLDRQLHVHLYALPLRPLWLDLWSKTSAARLPVVLGHRLAEGTGGAYAPPGRLARGVSLTDEDGRAVLHLLFNNVYILFDLVGQPEPLARLLLRKSLDLALPHLEASFALFSELGDDDLVLGVGWPLVWTLEESGRRERAWDVRHDLLRRAWETGNTAAQMRMLGGLAINALDLGMPAREALSFVHDHLPLALGENRETIAIALSRCAHVLARTGNIDPATQILARAEALFDELEDMERWVRAMNEDTLSLIRGHLDNAAFAEAYTRGRAMPLNGVIELAMEATSSGSSDESVVPARQTQVKATEAPRE